MLAVPTAPTHTHIYITQHKHIGKYSERGRERESTQLNTVTPIDTEEYGERAHIGTHREEGGGGEGARELHYLTLPG